MKAQKGLYNGTCKFGLLFVLYTGGYGQVQTGLVHLGFLRNAVLEYSCIESKHGANGFGTLACLGKFRVEIIIQLQNG